LTVVSEQRRQREDVVVVLASVPERLADLVAHLDESRLSYRHAPAFPTLGELTAHLHEAGVAVDALLRHAFLDGQREVHVLAAIDPPADPDRSRTLAELLDDYGRVRRRSVDLLRGLAPGDWKKELDDPGLGVIDLTEICNRVIQHELGHLTQVRNLTTLLPER
jgi:FAD/FMN-containing dehydrogenase